MTGPSEHRTLVLVRHAKAEQVLGKPDHDRSLTDRGRSDALAAGRWLHEQGVSPDLVICSTSVRTRETWAGISQGGCHTAYVEYRRAVYQDGTEGVLQSVREDGGEVDSLVVVGHSPGIPDAAALLSDGEGSSQAHRALAEGFPTSGIAVLEVEGEWADLEPGTARLVRVHVARG